MLIFSLIFTVLPLFNSIIDTLYESSLVKYGNYDAIFYDINEGQLKELAAHEDIKNTGVFNNYGNWKIENSEYGITLGSFDETAFSLSHFRFTEGRMPESENEIALEQNMKYHLPAGLKIGDSITIFVEETPITYTIVGILNDYIAYWDAPANNPIIKGTNDLPQGILSINNGLTPLVQNAITKGASDPLYGYRVASNLNIADCSVNSNLYGSREWRIEPLETFRSLFMVIVVFGIFLALNLGLNLYIESYQTTYTTLYQLGAEGEYPFYLYICQQLWAMLISIPFGMLVAWVFTIFVSPIIGSQVSIFTGDTLLLFAITIVMMLSFILYKFYRQIYRKRAVSMSAAKNKKKANQLQIGRNLSWALATNFMDVALKKVVPLLMLIAVLFSSIGLTRVYFNDRLESFYMSTMESESNVRFPDFTIDAAQIYSAGTFEILKLNMDKGRVIDKNIVRDFYTQEGVQYVNVTDYADNQASQLIPREKYPYWTDQDMTSYEDTAAGYISANVAGAPSIKDYYTIYHKFFVMDDVTREAICKAYPEKAESIRGLGENEAIFFLPVRENGVANQTYDIGEDIIFGELEYEGDFVTARNDPSLLTYKEHRLVIKDIISEELCFEVSGIEEWPVGYIILIGEETFLKNELFEGIQRFDIYLDPDISEEAYANVEENVREIGLSCNNSVIYSRKEQAEQDQSFVTIINTALVTMLLFLGIFVIACLAIVLYMTLLQRKQSIAMMRAIGMPRRTLSRAIFMEVCMYMLYCFVISVAVYFLMMYLIFGVFFSTSVSIANTLLMMRSLGICIIGMLFICSLVIHFLLNSIEKESISMAMRSVS
ncbi:MAG: FtsX-like permease family protein [Christensenellaceae bacterium]